MCSGGWVDTQCGQCCIVIISRQAVGKYGSCLAQGKNSYVETETVHMQTLYMYILT